MLMSGLAACGPVSSMQRRSNLDDTLWHYAAVMNRSDFPGAARFRLPSSRWDTKGLERFQVTHYQVQQTIPDESGKKVERSILLRYLDRHTMRERQQIYNEIWVYNSEAKQWQLDGEPPVIR
jgi:hypothetical protein